MLAHPGLAIASSRGIRPTAAPLLCICLSTLPLWLYVFTLGLLKISSSLFTFSLSSRSEEEGKEPEDKELSVISLIGPAISGCFY